MSRHIKSSLLVALLISLSLPSAAGKSTASKAVSATPALDEHHTSKRAALHDAMRKL